MDEAEPIAFKLNLFSSFTINTDRHGELMSVSSSLDSFFGITEKGSTLKTEVKGGVLVFLAMVYIIAVNSAMMSDAGVPYEEAYSATIIMTIIGSLLMGLYARYPVAMAPGMGINAMFCYTAVLGLGFTWQEALVAVIIAGAAFFVLTVSGIRQKLLDKIPLALKAGIIAGIGGFIAFIGLENARIITGASTLVGLGDMSDTFVLLGVFCIALTLFLRARGSSLAVLIGMLVTAVLAVIFGVTEIPSDIFSMPSAPPVGAFLDGITSDILSLKFLAVIITFAFVEFFDGSGTLIAVGKRAGFEDEKGNVTCSTALQVDAGIASLSGAIGCTPTTAFAESAVGADAGARTGLVPVVVAALFALSLFIAPLFQMVGYECTVGAMVVVGIAMMSELRDVDWSDGPSLVAVVMTVLMMILTYSITTGLAFGLIFYCVAMIGARRYREVSPVLYVMAVIFLLYLVMCAVAY